MLQDNFWTTEEAEEGIHFPVVVNTWPHPNCTDKAWSVVSSGGSAMDAVEAGCNVAEHDPYYQSVGYGKSCDEQGNVTLDAMIMDGETMQAGAVGALEGVKDAIKVARAVLNYTSHTLLVGRLATQFAVEMGFSVGTLTSKTSLDKWRRWKEDNCQPNFRRNVKPDPKHYCGPYKPLAAEEMDVKSSKRPAHTVDGSHHDTIGLVALDSRGHMAVGTSTNGANHKVPGRVGDTPIVGAGGFVDDEVGGAVGTGDGDVLIRFLLTYQAVEFMRAGMNPNEACEKSLRRVKQKGEWLGALVAMSNQGQVGAACIGMDYFTMCVRSPKTGNKTVVVPVKCLI